MITRRKGNKHVWTGLQCWVPSAQQPCKGREARRRGVPGPRSRGQRAGKLSLETKMTESKVVIFPGQLRPSRKLKAREA